MNCVARNKIKAIRSLCKKSITFFSQWSRNWTKKLNLWFEKSTFYIFNKLLYNEVCIVFNIHLYKDWIKINSNLIGENTILGTRHNVRNSLAMLWYLRHYESCSYTQASQAKTKMSHCDNRWWWRWLIIEHRAYIGIQNSEQVVLIRMFIYIYINFFLL